MNSLPLRDNDEPWKQRGSNWHAPPNLASLPKNVTQKVSAALRQHLDSLRNNQTTIVSDSGVALSLITAAQALQTSIASPRGLVRQTVSSVIAQPTQLAWQHIAQVVETIQAEPTLRAWTKYPPHVVWQSLQAIRRLQRALPKTEHHQHDSEVEYDASPDVAELEKVTKDLAYYSLYATLHKSGGIMYNRAIVSC